MALGGVAPAFMKAQLAAIAPGTVKKIGDYVLRHSPGRPSSGRKGLRPFGGVAGDSVRR